mmetsp:Transcript_30696/g.60086  ORF Transcript_30696/g.60086 Transcript_30696/m.60086 type:complete len:422 (-) Transcript_30696:177-1442(-)
MPDKKRWPIKPARAMKIKRVKVETVEAWISPEFRLPMTVNSQDTVGMLKDRVELRFGEALGHSIRVQALMDCNFNELPDVGKVEVLVCNNDRIHVLLDRKAKTTWFQPKADLPSRARIAKGFKRVFDACQALSGENSVMATWQRNKRVRTTRMDVKARWNRAGKLVGRLLRTAEHIDRLQRGGNFNGEMRDDLERLGAGLLLLPDVGRSITNVLLDPPDIANPELHSSPYQDPLSDADSEESAGNVAHDRKRRVEQILAAGTRKPQHKNQHTPGPERRQQGKTGRSNHDRKGKHGFEHQMEASSSRRHRSPKFPYERRQHSSFSGFDHARYQEPGFTESRQSEAQSFVLDNSGRIQNEATGEYVALSATQETRRMANVVSSGREHAKHYDTRHALEDMKFSAPWHARAEDAAGPALLRQRS